MNKKMIVLAVAGALAGSGNAFAAADTSANVSGFVDAVYMITNDTADKTVSDPTPASTDTANPVNNSFSANGEVDFSLTNGAFGGRIDLDVMESDTYVEQAFASWNIADNTNLLVGKMNNPVGQEKQDIVDRDFVTHNVVYNVLNLQTGGYYDGFEYIDRNNVNGVAVAGMAGMVNYVVAAVNDIGRGRETTAMQLFGTAPGDVAYDSYDANSFAFNVGVAPIEGLNVALGYINQAGYDPITNPTSAGSVVDLNADYMWNDLKVGFDYLSPSDVVDNAYTVWGTYGFPGGLGIGLRYDAASFDAKLFDGTDATSPFTTTGTGKVDDVTATTFYVSYMPAENFDVKLEFKNGSSWDRNATGNQSVTDEMAATAGIYDGALTQIDVVAKF